MLGLVDAFNDGRIRDAIMRPSDPDPRISQDRDVLHAERSVLRERQRGVPPDELDVRRDEPRLDVELLRVDDAVDGGEHRLQVVDRPLAEDVDLPPGGDVQDGQPLGGGGQLLLEDFAGWIRVGCECWLRMSEESTRLTLGRRV